MMKKISLLLIIGLWVINTHAQTDYENDFKIVKELKSTEVKNQAKSGTCWAFATLSFVESELIRMGQGNFDLSEMYIVNKIYHEKAKRYLDKEGKINFGPGGQAHDVMTAISKYGLLTEDLYPGIKYGGKQHNHAELDAIMSEMVNTFSEKKNGSLTGISLQALDAVLNTYLGGIPDTFSTNGKNFTPRLFVTELGFNPSDYVELTSLSDYPYYKTFILPVPDNWSENPYYNLHLDELIEVMDSAINNGYTVCWDGDVSGDFSRTRGVAELDDDIKPKESVRQKLFNQKVTTDDHLMHITGIAEGKNGNTYYLTKNSWGTENLYGGYWFMSKDFAKINTIAIMVHKDAIPVKIATQLGIK